MTDEPEHTTSTEPSSDEAAEDLRDHAPADRETSGTDQADASPSGGADADNGADDEERSPRVVVASPDGIGIAEQEQVKDPTAAVEEPAKVMRLGAMIKQLLEEVRSAPLDDAARERMAQIHERSLAELESGLSPELNEELHRITLPFTENQTPSDGELRIAQAQLVGWLEGLFHGIQTALVAQQMAAQNQLQQMRKALPPGTGHGTQIPPGLIVNRPEESDTRGTGQYL